MNVKLQLTEVISQLRFDFDDLPIIIGRDSSADIQLDDSTLPPFQCMIGEFADGGIVVWSLRNDYPVYVNDRRVAKAKLFDGDELKIGQSRFILSCEDISIAPRSARTAVLAKC
jgi:pSer/pThr/pTyr-binding forkhead associated (FHA) protein